MQTFLQRLHRPKNIQALLPIIGIVLAFIVPSLFLFGRYILSGDGGRDLLDLYTAYSHHVLPLVGPSASVGQFHVGPIFYYLLLPPLIISGFQPIVPVLVAILLNGLLVAMGYKLFKDFGSQRGAFFFVALAVFSPYLVHLARGSWNPNPQPLVTMVLLYSLMKLIERPTARYFLILGLTIGCGVQLHYTFLSNVPTAAAILVLFRWKILANWRLYAFTALGAILPLIPFAIGQKYLQYRDIRGLVHYLRSTHINIADILNPHLLWEHVMSPFTSFFQVPGGGRGWLIGATIVWLIILGLVAWAALTKNKAAKLAAVALVFCLLNTAQAHVKNLSFQHYYLFYSVIVLVLAAVALDQLVLKRRWVGAGMAVSLLGWELVTLPAAYRIDRTPGAVERTAEWIYADAKANPTPDSTPVKIYLDSPISSWDGFEYRFFLERRGLATGFDFTGAARYLIVENKPGVQPHAIPGYEQVKNMPMNDASYLIKSITVYRLILTK